MRTKVTLAQRNRHYRDHAEEIASGSVQVLDVSPAKAKEIADAAARTDGIIFHLWPHGTKVPEGAVTFLPSIGHKPVEKLEVSR